MLAIQREGEAIDLHMVEIMEMAHRTDTDTRSDTHTHLTHLTHAHTHTAVW